MNWEKVTLQYRSTSQIQELQERMNQINDSREVHDVESICSAKLFHVPSQLAIVPSLGGMLSRDPCLRPETWNLLGTSGNVFDSPRAVLDSSSTTYQGMLHSLDRSATGETQCEKVQGNLSPEVKKEIKRRFQPRDLQGDHQPWILSFQQKECIHRITWLIKLNYRSRNFNLTNSPHVQLFHVGR